MTTAIHLCGPDDQDRLLSLVSQLHAELGRDVSDEQRIAAVAPLLEGSPHGVAYLFGPRIAPVGYLVMTFSWSIEFGGMDAFLDEIWIRPSVRGRGIGSEAFGAVVKALAGAGLKAVHMEVDPANEKVQRLYGKKGYEMGDSINLMTRRM